MEKWIPRSIDIHHLYFWLLFQYVWTIMLCRRHCLFGSARKDELLSLKVLHTSLPWALHVNMSVTHAVHKHCHCPSIVYSVSYHTFTFSV